MRISNLAGVNKMKMDEVIEQINFLYKKSQNEGLTEEEKIKQKELRQVYIDSIKRNFKAQLDGIKRVPSNEKLN